mmetsp:Transcript_21787/g.50189  ORF Transcript_21787/g.50189 Transcript_21787/m.50189 type:complete len:120 (-) Transcript_21787:108-467(-)
MAAFSWRALACTLAAMWLLCVVDGSYCPPGHYTSSVPLDGFGGGGGDGRGAGGGIRQRTCTPCEPGKYSDSYAVYTTECTWCEAGKYSPTTGALSCIACSRGKYSLSPGGVECKPRSGS